MKIMDFPDNVTKLIEMPYYKGYKPIAIGRIFEI